MDQQLKQNICQAKIQLKIEGEIDTQHNFCICIVNNSQEQQKQYSTPEIFMENKQIIQTIDNFDTNLLNDNFDILIKQNEVVLAQQQNNKLQNQNSFHLEFIGEQDQKQKFFLDLNFQKSQDQELSQKDVGENEKDNQNDNLNANENQDIQNNDNEKEKELKQDTNQEINIEKQEKEDLIQQLNQHEENTSKENQSQHDYKFIIQEIRAYFQKEIDIKRGIEYDTFSTIKIGDNQQKTEIAYNCGNQPEWQDVFVYYVNNQRFIEIEIYDMKPKGKTKYNGKATFQIDNFKKNKTIHNYKNIKGDVLEYKGETKLVKGHIYLDICSIPPNTYQESKKQGNRNIKVRNNRLIECIETQENDETQPLHNIQQTDHQNSKEQQKSVLQSLENDTIKIQNNYLKKRTGLQAQKFMYEKCTFGTSRADIYQPKNETPAPNQYKQETSIGKETTPITLKFRIQQSNHQADTPGPNQYQNSVNSQKIQKNSGWSIMGLGERQKIIQSDSPGPANYNIQSKFETMSINLNKSQIDNNNNSYVNSKNLIQQSKNQPQISSNSLNQNNQEMSQNNIDQKLQEQQEQQEEQNNEQNLKKENSQNDENLNQVNEINTIEEKIEN